MNLKPGQISYCHKSSCTNCPQSTHLWQESGTKHKAKHPPHHSLRTNSVYLKQLKHNCYIMIQLFSVKQSVFKVYVSLYTLCTNSFSLTLSPLDSYHLGFIALPYKFLLGTLQVPLCYAQIQE